MKKAVRHSGNLQELSGMIATEGGNAIELSGSAKPALGVQFLPS